LFAFGVGIVGIFACEPLEPGSSLPGESNEMWVRAPRSWSGPSGATRRGL